MLEYTNRKIYVDNNEYDFEGLNTSHILWHLQELDKPENFIYNLNEVYTMPNNIGYMSIAEGETFDALLVDDRMFRCEKLTESDRDEIQDYINRYAYATALVKLNECSNIIGCGLKHEYSLEESYTFISKCYDKLFENAYITSEKGKLVESFGTNNKVNIYEGNENYLRGIGSKRVVENWQNPFKFKNISRYLLENAEQVGTGVKLDFIDSKGVKMTAIFENTDLKLVNAGINLKYFLNKNKLVESYRTGTLLEYHQPFTLRAASLLSYEPYNDLLKLTMKDAFGNRGEVYATLTIPVKDFIRKYKRKMNKIISEPYASDNIRETSNFLGDAASDISSLSRIKNMTTDSENPVLSYKVAPFTPIKGDGELVSRKRDDRNKFIISVVDDEGTPYNLVYSYRGSNIDKDIETLNNLSDEFDFNDVSDVYSFYSIVDDYGNIERSARRGISTKDRNYKRNVKEEGEIMEGEGVQVSDIAPKLDQNVGTIQVKMKKRKSKKVESDIIDFKKSDLLISKINEQDEFYGARGFIKDEYGRYHFGDYYITESGKVMHKSKIKKLEEEKITKLKREFLSEALYRDRAGKNGIFSYFDMLYGQEPQSEYDKLLLKYMHTYDDIRDKIDDLHKQYNDGKITKEELDTKWNKLADEDEKNTQLLLKANKIPEEDRGPQYKDFMEIDAANNEEFEQKYGKFELEPKKEEPIPHTGNKRIDRLRDVLMSRPRDEYLTKLFGDLTKTYSLAECIDPEDYIEWLNKNGYKIETELDKLCYEDSKLFDEFVKWHTKAMDIYPGFDGQDGAEKHLSKSDFEKYKKYDDKYEELRAKARGISLKMRHMSDEDLDDKALKYLEQKYLKEK